MGDPVSRILQVSTWDIAGGAEKIARDLFTSYRALGYRSWLAVGGKRSRDLDIFSIPGDPGRISRAIPFCTDRFPCVTDVGKKLDALKHPVRIYNSLAGYEDFDHPRSWDLLNLVPEPPEILHCHNLHGGYFDLRALPDLSRRIPTVLTLHDAWLLAGHCAHSFDCERWKTGCGNCPDLSLYPAIRRDKTAYNWQRKAEIYRKSQVHVVTPSRRLMGMVEESVLKPGIVTSRVIPNGVNLKIFHPTAREEARRDLGLPRDEKILLFAANGARKNLWKDYGTLQSALKEIAKTGAKVLCVVLGEAAPAKRIRDVRIMFVSFQRDPERVARYYRAADLYVHPARADTFPNTVIESLACGTPVVASAVGGISEQVIEGRTGFLVPAGSALAMTGRILDLLADEDLRLWMGRQAAEDATKRFGMERMVEEYLEFYRVIHDGSGLYDSSESHV